MSAIASDSVVAVFLVFCRIGACLMVLPGFSSARIPVRFRLFIAVAATLALSPLLVSAVKPVVTEAPGPLLLVIGSELLIGFLIGLLARLFFMALQTIATAIVQSIGLAGLPGISMEDDEQIPALATLLSLSAVLMMFLTDQHWQIVRGLLDSYATLPPRVGFDPQASLIDVTDQLAAVFVLVLRLGSPFIIYSVVINFAVGLANKLTPQIPVYFIGLPFVMAGGILLLVFTVRDFLASFVSAFGLWLSGG